MPTIHNSRWPHSSETAWPREQGYRSLPAFSRSWFYCPACEQSTQRCKKAAWLRLITRGCFLAGSCLSQKAAIGQKQSFNEGRFDPEATPSSACKTGIQRVARRRHAGFVRSINMTEMSFHTVTPGKSFGTTAKPSITQAIFRRRPISTKPLQAPRRFSRIL